MNRVDPYANYENLNSADIRRYRNKSQANKDLITNLRLGVRKNLQEDINWINEFCNLENLIISGASLTSIDFINLPRLKTLDISSNLLVNLPETLPPSIERLIVSRNKFTVCRFGNYPNLRFLDITNNKINSYEGNLLPECQLKTEFLGNDVLLRLNRIPNIYLTIVNQIILNIDNRYHFQKLKIEYNYMMNRFNNIIDNPHITHLEIKNKLGSEYESIFDLTLPNLTHLKLVNTGNVTLDTFNVPNLTNIEIVLDEDNQRQIQTVDQMIDLFFNKNLPIIEPNRNIRMLNNTEINYEIRRANFTLYHNRNLVNDPIPALTEQINNLRLQNERNNIGNLIRDQINIFRRNLQENYDGLNPEDIEQYRIRIGLNENQQAIWVNKMIQTGLHEQLERINNKITQDNNSIQIYQNFLREDERAQNQIQVNAQVDRRFDQLINTTTKPRTVYDDGQNVHDSSVTGQFSKSVKRLIDNCPVKPNDYNYAGCGSFLSDKVITNDVRIQVVTYINDKTKLGNINMNFEQLFSVVWYYAKDNDEIKKRINEEMKDAKNLCLTGRITRLINVLSGFNENVMIGISENERISAVILNFIKNPNNDKLTVEEKRQKCRELLTEFDINTVNVFVDNIDE